jgi:hypothetical protein
MVKDIRVAQQRSNKLNPSKVDFQLQISSSAARN